MNLIPISGRGHRYTDLAGKKYGRLVIVKDVGRKHGAVLWRCLCDCGAVTDVTSMSLGKGETQSCGCLHREGVAAINGKDLTGRIYHRLTVIEKLDERRGGYVLWKCLCQCGNHTKASTPDLVSGHTKSCGCLQREWAQKHMAEIHKWLRGEKHPCWNGGNSSPYPDIWTPQFLARIRKRDGCKCRVCGRRDIILDVHHIDENKENCSEDNLITLCRSCHKKVHWKTVSIQEPPCP